MCQIHVTVNATATIHYTREAAQALYESNSDGLGFVDFAKPQLAVKIVPMDFEEAWAFIEQHIQGKQGVVHWRMRTSGALDTDRVHPYVINDTYYLIHNGVMREWESEVTKVPATYKRDKEGKVEIVNNKVVELIAAHSVSDGKSDTQNLAEWLEPLLSAFPGLERTEHFQFLMSEHIGAGNRLVIVNRETAECTIINKSTGNNSYPGIWQANDYAGDYVYDPITGHWDFGGHYRGNTVKAKKRKSKKSQKTPTLQGLNTAAAALRQKVAEAEERQKWVGERLNYWNLRLADAAQSIDGMSHDPAACPSTGETLSVSEISKRVTALKGMAVDNSLATATEALKKVREQIAALSVAANDSEQDRLDTALEPYSGYYSGIQDAEEEDWESLACRLPAPAGPAAQVTYPSPRIAMKSDVVEWLDHFSVARAEDGILLNALRNYSLSHPSAWSAQCDFLEDLIAGYLVHRSAKAGAKVIEMLEIILKDIAPPISEKVH